MNQPYYMPKPIEPSQDWIARLLGTSLVISVIGLSIYGLFAFAFDDIKIIPDAAQSVLVVIGSALIVIGAEMNTPPTLVAVWRKAGRGKATRMDYWICILSLIGGVAGVLIVFSIRQTLLGEDGWRAWTTAIGPLFVGVTIVIDYYGCAAELGLLRSDYDAEMREWLEAEQEWNQTHEIETVDDRTGWPIARVGDFRAILKANGNQADLTKENLQSHFDKMGRLVPSSQSTIDRWFREELN